MSKYVTYETAKVRNGTVKLGDRVRYEFSGEEGTVLRIRRWHPIKSSKTEIEIADAEGIYLNQGPAKAFTKI